MGFIEFPRPLRERKEVIVLGSFRRRMSYG